MRTDGQNGREACFLSMAKLLIRLGLSSSRHNFFCERAII